MGSGISSRLSLLAGAEEVDEDTAKLIGMCLVDKTALCIMIVLNLRFSLLRSREILERQGPTSIRGAPKFGRLCSAGDFLATLA